MTDKRECPVRDNISVEKTNPTTAHCPVRDNIWVEHIAYLTARPCSGIFVFYQHSIPNGMLFRKECKRGIYFVRVPY